MNTGQVKAFKLATLRSQYKFYFEIPVHEFWYQNALIMRYYT